MKSKTARISVRLLLIALVLGTIAPLIVACAQSTPAAPAPSAKAIKPIKVSIGMDHTGPTSGATLHQFRGADHYFRWINEQGGIDGTQLEVLWADTQYKVPVDVEYYKRARDQGSVIHIMTATAAAAALAQQAADDKMPVLNNSGDPLFLIPPRTIVSANVPLNSPATIVYHESMPD